MAERNDKQIGLDDSERQPCEVWTRVMGYHRPVSSFNAGKKGEYAERKLFVEPQFGERVQVVSCPVINQQGRFLMTKQELLRSITDQAGVTQKQAEAVLDAFIDTVRDTIVRRGELQVTGLGKFATAKREARQGRNPQTGEPMTIPAKCVPTFRFSADLKRAVGGK